MRRVGIVLLLSLTAIAGCLSDDAADDSPDVPETPVAHGYVLDCSISNWDEPCLAHASPNESPSKTEIDVAVNPLDPMNIVIGAKDNDPLATESCVWSVVQVTKDGGHNWTTVYIGGKISERQPGELLYGMECVSDPIMVFNKDGDLFYTLQASENENEPDTAALLADPDEAFMGLAVSHDGGMTWPEITMLQPGDETSVFPDYIRMGTNPKTGSVFTTWNNIVGLATSQAIVYAIRDGVPAAQPFPFLAPDSPTGLGESGIVGATDGTIYVCLCGPNSGPAAYWSVSTDDGQTFSTPTKVFDYVPMNDFSGVEFRVSSRVEIAVDNSGGESDGCLYGTWAGRDQVTNSSDPSDVYVRKTCDGGATWTDPLNIAPDSTVGGQWMPRVAVDGRGGVHIVFMTQHYDEEHGHNWIDAEWAHSEDGGATWTSQRLTTISSDGDLGVHQRDFPFIGDYVGISAVGDDIWMAFPTAFTGVTEIAAAHVQYQ